VLGKTQSEVALTLGISQSDYSKVERRRDVRVSTLRSIAQAFGGTLALLLELPGRSVELAIGNAGDAAVRGESSEHADTSPKSRSSVSSTRSDVGPPVRR
jgi:transcriptional regulator with XRE-family HTH domain